MKAISRIFARLTTAIEVAKRQNVAAMNPEKRPEYFPCHTIISIVETVSSISETVCSMHLKVSKSI